MDCAAAALSVFFLLRRFDDDWDFKQGRGGGAPGGLRKGNEWTLLFNGPGGGGRLVSNFFTLGFGELLRLESAAPADRGRVVPSESGPFSLSHPRFYLVATSGLPSLVSAVKTITLLGFVGWEASANSYFFCIGVTIA
mmetsp:Transcript_39738/g.46457  ORF Transcript_39738/g.46457 Transcript_39738/m.46457 type:complete len:138 (+) Transcript_39738:172-585(+)